MSLWERLPNDVDFSVDGMKYVFVSPKGTRLVCEDDQKVSWVVRMIQVIEGHGHENLKVVFMKHLEDRVFEKIPKQNFTLRLSCDDELIDAGLPVNGYYHIIGSYRGVSMEEEGVDNDDFVMVTPSGQSVRLDSDEGSEKAVLEFRRLERVEVNAVHVDFVCDGGGVKLSREIKLGDNQSFYDMSLPTNGYYQVYGIEETTENHYGNIDQDDVWVYTPSGNRAKFDADTESQRIVEFIRTERGNHDNMLDLDFYVDDELGGFEKKGEFNLMEEEKSLYEVGIPVNGYYLVTKSSFYIEPPPPKPKKKKDQSNGSKLTLCLILMFVIILIFALFVLLA